MEGGGNKSLNLFQHNMTVIASDGNDLQPYTVHGLVVHIGERYDVYINADQAVSTYWIRFTMLNDLVGYLEMLFRNDIL